MTILRVPLLILLLVASLPAVALAQAAPVPPTERVVGRVLTLDEAIAIALEAQPTIQATLYDYAAARARVAPMLERLARLPRVTGVSTPTVSRDGSVGFATVRFDDQGDALPTKAIRRVVDTAQAAASPQLEVELNGNAIEQLYRPSPGPAATATYWLPPKLNVMGEAFMRTLVGNCHSVLPFRWSTAANPPFGWP